MVEGRRRATDRPAPARALLLLLVLLQRVLFLLMFEGEYPANRLSNKQRLLLLLTRPQGYPQETEDPLVPRELEQQ